jgi:hypothetical protein
MFELNKEDKDAGVQIDPTLFSQYNITTVPALVVTCPGHMTLSGEVCPCSRRWKKWLKAVIVRQRPAIFWRPANEKTAFNGADAFSASGWC